MGNDVPDALLIGQRVVAILETGLRTATYKLATASHIYALRLSNSRSVARIPSATRLCPPVIAAVQ